MTMTKKVILITVTVLLIVAAAQPNPPKERAELATTKTVKL